MTLSSTLPRYLLRWDHANDGRSMHSEVTSSHRLRELSIFSDIGLADLIDCHPRSAITVSRSGNEPSHPSEQQFGRLGSCGSVETLEALRMGRFSLMLRDLHRHNPVLQSIGQRLNEELAECINLWDVSSHQVDLLLESPGSQTYLRCDGKPTVRWQVRGSSHVWKYPVSLPGVDPRSIERFLLQPASASKSLYFEPALDDHASVFELTGGGMIGMPMCAPYRVLVDGSLSVSLITRYFDHQSRRRYQSIVGNQVLGKICDRRSRIDRDGVPAEHGPIASLKRSIARTFCQATLQRAGLISQADDAETTFLVDPNAMHGFSRLADSVTGAIAASSVADSISIQPIHSPSQIPTPVLTTES